MALRKLKTYDLNEELLKILKKELEEKNTRLYRIPIQHLSKLMNL